MVAATTVAGLATSEARADVASGGPANTSIGVAPLRYEHNKGLDTSIDTGWRGFNSNSNLSAEVRAVAKLDPVAPGLPLYVVDMAKGAIVQASWSGDKKIVLKTANGAQTDGTITVRHTITPSLELRVHAFGISAQFGYDSTALLNLLQNNLGANAYWDYDSKASAQFMPWGWAPAQVKLNSPDLLGAKLFEFDLASFPDFVSNNFEGAVGVRAITKPTFAYKTKKVTLGGANGAVAAAGGEVSLPAPDADYLETMATVEGDMSVQGSMDLQPYVHLTTVPVLGPNQNIDIPITVFKADYTVASSPVLFSAVKVHIPLPNVHAPRQGVSIGNAQGGSGVSKTVTIENSGEKAAVVTFKSSDPQFQVPGGSITIDPKGKYDMEIKFAAANSGPASAEVTVMSNDADSPEQVFKVGGNGADVGDPNGPDGDGAGKDGNADSGCGCKTAGTSTLPNWAGLGLIGLGAAAFIRRRRSA